MGGPFGGSGAAGVANQRQTRRMSRAALAAAIIISSVLIASLDFSTSSELIGSILFTLPLALCALQPSTRLLWGVAIAALGATIAANFWGFDRGQIEITVDGLVNRGLVFCSLLTLAAFIHFAIVGSRKAGRDRAQVAHQTAGGLLIEEALRASDERYRLLLDSIQDRAIFMLDPQGLVISWNAGAQRIKGYTEAEIIGRSFACFFSVVMVGPRRVELD